MTQKTGTFEMRSGSHVQLAATDHSLYMTRSETHCYGVPNKDSTAIYMWLAILKQLTRQCNPCTNSCDESSGRSIGIAASYYFHLCNEINKCICMKYVSSRY